MEIKNYLGEVWRPVKGFEGFYEVSNCGRVKNLKTGFIFKGETDWKGYRRVTLKKKHYKIHRLVAEAFIPNPYNLPCINHKDCNPSNNCVDNLEWCDYQYNNRYGDRLDKVYNANPHNRIRQYDLNGKPIRTFKDMRSVVSFYKKDMVWANNIGLCCRGKRKTAYGFKWKYLKPVIKRSNFFTLLQYRQGQLQPLLYVLQNGGIGGVSYPYHPYLQQEP